MDRDKEGNEVPSDLELNRLAVPRRVYTVSHAEYVADRVGWLYQRRSFVKGLRFVEEPPVLRFFFWKLEPIDNLGAKLAEEFKKESDANY